MYNKQERAECDINVTTRRAIEPANTIVPIVYNRIHRTQSYPSYTILSMIFYIKFVHDTLLSMFVLYYFCILLGLRIYV